MAYQISRQACEVVVICVSLWRCNDVQIGSPENHPIEEVRQLRRK